MTAKRKKLTKKEWKELELLKDETGERFNSLVERTHNHYEHPEWYKGYCECYTCLSYA